MVRTGRSVLTRGEEADFTSLVQRQSRFVFRVAYGVLLNAADAEDAVQETFLKLYRSGDWRQARNECAYLARVAWRTAVDKRRSAAARFEDTACAIEPASGEAGPEREAIAGSEIARVHALINALPEDLRMPLILSAGEELNSREIARALDIPEGTVRTRLQRARQLLREKLNVQPRKEAKPLCANPSMTCSTKP
jgi:RNA polymerase sigma-70 factor (ECF subfamily)